MRAPQERAVRDLYDRTRHRDPAAAEEPAKGRGGGRAEGSGHREVVVKMEDKTAVRKRLVSSDNTRVKAESGTCNVCYAPCSSCLHRTIELADSNVDCGSSQTCSTRSEIKNNSIIRSEKGLRNRGENDDEFSAVSSNASYSETGGNKAVQKSSIAEDSSEVDMPAKRRRLSNQDTGLSRAEYHDDSNSCVTGIPAEDKLLQEKKKLSTSASSRDLTIKDHKGSSYSRLRNQCADESTEKKGSDVFDMHPSSSGKLFAADTPSVMRKKLLRTQSSVSASKGLSPKRQGHEFGKAQANSSRQPCEKAFPSNNIIERPLGGKSNPFVGGGDTHGMLTGCSASNRNENKAELSLKDLENDTLYSKDEIQEHADIQSNDKAKRNGGDKQDCDQDCSMDISSDGKLNTQNGLMTDCGNSESLIDVNVCDICGDVGREYLLATCTRCLEGAEHTYCMRVKLNKVPDGEWLCEECQLKDEQGKTRRKYGAMTVNISDGKNQSSESQNNPKAVQVAVPNLDAPQTTCCTPTADQCDANNQKLHFVSADTQPRQLNVATPAAERLDVKNKKILSLANHKILQVVTSNLEARTHTNGPLTPGSSNKKNQSSDFLLNRKKLRVSTDVEPPLSSEGLRSPPISCKRQAGNTWSPNPNIFKTDSLRKRDVFSLQNSFKKSNQGSLNALDNAAVRNTQAVKSSHTLSRSYSMGSMVNAKATVPLPKGSLSKQLSFNSSNKGPKVKQLAEGVASKLRPVKHSPRDPRDKGPIKQVMKSGSFKSEGSVCKDAGPSKQKQSFHLSQDEKTGILKPMKEKNLIERKASFSFKKPNIPSSPRPDSSLKSGARKPDQDISRPGPSILKSSKKPGLENVEKKQSLDLSKSDKQDVTVHQKPTGFVSGKDAYTVKISDPTVTSQCVKKDNLSDDDEDSFAPVKGGNGMPTEPPEVLSTRCASVTCESDLLDIVPTAIPSDDLASKRKPLESTIDDSHKIVEAAHTSEDILPESPHCPRLAHDLYPTGNKLDKPDLKHETFVDQSLTLGNPSRDLVIPEESYIWQGTFEVSRHGNSPEMFDGIQAYLSTCASSKVREVGKQLPHKIQLAQVPWHSSWPLQFKEVYPTENSIALFFFAKDVESYERAYVKLLESMLLGDLSLTANVGSTELLIFPSDKLPERIQRWNGLPFFWGIFYARGASSSPELPVTGTNNCPSQPITRPVIQPDVCSPKALQSLGIDLNECPNDDLSDMDVSLGSEMEKSGASVDHNILLKSKHVDRKLNGCEIHHEETAGTGQTILGHPTTASCGTHLSTISTEGHSIMQDYPSAAKGTTGTTCGGNMGEDDGICQDKTLLIVAQQAGAIRSTSDEMIAKKQALLPSLEVFSQHLSGSKISGGPSKLIPKSDMAPLDSDSSYKRQKTSHGKLSTCSSGNEQLPSKCLSETHPLMADQHNPFDDVQYTYKGPLDLGFLKKSIPDHVIHVLSSDDEDSPEPSTSSNKASLKADVKSSPLLSLSLPTVATKHNLVGSDIGEDEPLSLSLGLPVVVEGNRALEMKQFLPEKPGINT